MTLQDYQDFTKTSAIYPKEAALSYLGLGLVNEAGEVAGVIKKILRKDFDELPIDKIKAELGDVMWYMSELCNYLGLTIEEVLEYNQIKLNDRKQRGVLQGSGDTR